jgi:hypothetical protein
MNWWWLVVTVSSPMLIRIVVFHNVTFDTVVWTLFAVGVSTILNLVISEGVVYTIAWFALIIFNKRAKKQLKEYGDYDAP